MQLKNIIKYKNQSLALLELWQISGEKLQKSTEEKET